MARIFWDTNPYIYLFEDHPEFAPRVAKLRLRMLQQADQLITSFMTVGEIQVKALKEGRPEVAGDLKRRILLSSTVLAFDDKAADAYALLRATTNIKGPDAIQLACASAYGVDTFFTNDSELQKLRVSGIREIRVWNLS